MKFTQSHKNIHSSRAGNRMGKLLRLGVTAWMGIAIFASSERAAADNRPFGANNDTVLPAPQAQNSRDEEKAGAVLPSNAISADRKCFLPQKSTGNRSDLFVEPKSKVCRAFERELNASCAGAIPIVEFMPKLQDSRLIEPAWEQIALYTPDGSEDAAAFALLQKLIWSRSVTGYSMDQETRAKRDVGMILAGVRAAHAGNRSPRFDKVTLDLEGRGRKEVLYRLYTGLLGNPDSLNDKNISFKSEPYLFLDRAIAIASSASLAKVSPHAAGNDVTGGPADVLLFDSVPYFLHWSGDDVLLVYASYLQPNRPMIPDESIEHGTFIIPLLRCMFESRPTH
jgi:hypothetical protein